MDNDADDDGVCDDDEIIGCQDNQACNYNVAATDAGTCIYIEGICDTCSGETDGTGVVVDNDADDDGVCDDDEIIGCQDDQACNYNASATDAGTCIYLEEGECDCEGNVLDECGVCGGSGIPEGACDCNGDTLDAIGVCGGDCISDYNLNGICDSNEVIGCTYEEASNFNANATLDDGSCVYEDCDITIDNQAAFDAGVASVDITSNDQAVYDGAFADGVASVICPEVDACPMDLNNDNLIGTSDLLELLGAFGNECLEE